jgi:hypothetical protein
MIKVDWETEDVSIVSEPIHLNMDDHPEDDENDGLRPRPGDLPTQRLSSQPRASRPYRTQNPMRAATPDTRYRDPKITIGAIDNSLSWPWKHPDAWRR